MEAELRRRQRNKIDRYFPDSGPLRRELYPQQLKFFAAGAEHRERAFMAANRCGKTEAGVYEMTCHLTGEYPHWWVGKRFDRANSWWAAGDTSKTTRDILQAKCVGPLNDLGTGMIPGDRIIHKTMKQGIPDALDTVYVKHASGGASMLGFKSYDQGRRTFQGTEQSGILLDEEPPEEVYVEALLRTMTTNGIVLLTFTPLSGVSSVVLSFLPGGRVQE